MKINNYSKLLQKRKRTNELDGRYLGTMKCSKHFIPPETAERYWISVMVGWARDWHIWCLNRCDEIPALPCEIPALPGLSDTSVVIRNNCRVRLGAVRGPPAETPASHQARPRLAGALTGLPVRGQAGQLEVSGARGQAAAQAQWLAGRSSDREAASARPLTVGLATVRGRPGNRWTWRLSSLLGRQSVRPAGRDPGWPCTYSATGARAMSGRRCDTVRQRRLLSESK